MMTDLDGAAQSAKDLHHCWKSSAGCELGVVGERLASTANLRQRTREAKAGTSIAKPATRARARTKAKKSGSWPVRRRRWSEGQRATSDQTDRRARRREVGGAGTMPRGLRDAPS